MKSFRQLIEAGSFGYSSATWKYYVMKDGKVVDGKYYDKKHEADRKATEVGGQVKKTRW